MPGATGPMDDGAARRRPSYAASGVELLRLGEVLVRRAVAVVRQRHPLARRALAGARAALQRVAVRVEAVLRLAGAGNSSASAR